MQCITAQRSAAQHNAMQSLGFCFDNEWFDVKMHHAKSRKAFKWFENENYERLEKLEKLILANLLVEEIGRGLLSATVGRELLLAQKAL